MDKASLTRFFGLIVALLAYFGVNIPETVVDGLTMVTVGALAVYAAWKDNNITRKTVENKQKLAKLEEEQTK